MIETCAILFSRRGAYHKVVKGHVGGVLLYGKEAKVVRGRVCDDLLRIKDLSQAKFHVAGRRGEYLRIGRVQVGVLRSIYSQNVASSPPRCFFELAATPYLWPEQAHTSPKKIFFRVTASPALDLTSIETASNEGACASRHATKAPCPNRGGKGERVRSHTTREVSSVEPRHGAWCVVFVGRGYRSVSYSWALEAPRTQRRHNR